MKENGNNEIKSQTLQQLEETTVGQDKKFKQENGKKPKKVLTRIIRGVIFSLIIGIIAGAVGLYFLQENTNYWFIIPTTLTKKVEDSNNTATNIVQDEIVKEDKNNTQKEEIKTITIDEAYEKLEELYNICVKMYLHFPAEYFTVDSQSHPSISTSAIEVTDYEKVMTKYFTKSAKAEYEDYNQDILIEENDKIYMETVEGVIGIDYLDTVFTKVVITEDSITCIVNNMYKIGRAHV